MPAGTGDRLQVTIDPLQCARTGYCVEVVPDVFALVEDGPTVVVDPDPAAERLEELREAEGLCPTQAIRVDRFPADP
jgi:ferredoxin